MPDVYKQSFKQNYTNNIELSIFNCGLERCAPGQTWGPGIRDHYLIHLVVSGKGIFEVGGRTWEVSEGDLFFARPSQLIRYTADEQQPWEYSWVGFNGACAHKLAAQLPFTDDAPVHHTSDPDGMRAALNNIYSSRGLQPQDEAAMVGYLYPVSYTHLTGNDAVAEFVGKKAVFYQNGTWAYNDVKDLGDDNLGMLPIYIGVDGEENQGLCTGSENFWCVNNTSSEADIQATLDFLYWCCLLYTSREPMCAASALPATAILRVRASSVRPISLISLHGVSRRRCV